ncbi:MAG: hypothetical protein ACTSO9_02925 [Candidatus Helarchaeota archaeon]
MRKIIISITLVVISLCLIAVGFTLHQNLEYDTLMFLLKWQHRFVIF